MKKAIFIFVFMSCWFFGQEINISVLENEIYQNNRSGKHQKSQAKLLNLLEDKNLSTDDEVKLNYLMAATFRSIDDYGSAIKYLKRAMAIAGDADHHDSLKINIQAEMAFAYFDDNKYAESEKIIKEISGKRYKNLDENSKAYIIMQQGYIDFLAKKYESAEKNYDVALSILKKVSVCNQPAVLVKMMELQSAKKNFVSVDDIYSRCIRIADSCKILKYKVYATEEIREIYQRNGDKDKVFQHTKMLDSLNLLFNREKNLSDMHIQNEEYLESKTEKQEEISTVTMIISSIVVIILICTGLYFLRKSVRDRAEKLKIQDELEALKEELKIFSQAQISKNPEKEEILNTANLNRRQKEILDLIAGGFTNKEIADKLSVTEATIKYHIRNLYAALDIKNRKDMLKKFSTR
ncbi:hypothetical protein ASG01_08495 [Chryseobacterium sp. Leaf180]|nr:hypothetical protein ASG01_08495 [Chryseobacterium sp. Leaf180]